MTLGQLLTRYYFERVRLRRKRYRTHWNKVLRWVWRAQAENIKLGEMTVVDLHEVLLRVRQGCGDRFAVWRTMYYIRMAWRWAQKEGLTDLPFPGEAFYARVRGMILRGEATYGLERLFPPRGPVHDPEQVLKAEEPVWREVSWLARSLSLQPTSVQTVQKRRVRDGLRPALLSPAPVPKRKYVPPRD
jgi:hypothetical protein